MYDMSRGGKKRQSKQTNKKAQTENPKKWPRDTKITYSFENRIFWLLTKGL